MTLHQLIVTPFEWCTANTMDKIAWPGASQL